ncbi:MAG: hypothetical protein ACE5EK_02980 [Nitrospinales bacterium]
MIWCKMYPADSRRKFEPKPENVARRKQTPPTGSGALGRKKFEPKQERTARREQIRPPLRSADSFLRTIAIGSMIAING